MEDPDLRRFIRQYFSGYHSDPIEAPIELAREVVFGSVQYARDLGFDPHPDFAAAAGRSSAPLSVLSATGNFEVLAIVG